MSGKAVNALVVAALFSLAIPSQAQHTTDKMKTVHVVKTNIEKARPKALDQLIEEAKHDGKISTFTNEEDHIRELDIKYTGEQLKELMNQGGRITAFNAHRPLSTRWTNHMVPYKILPKCSSTELRIIQRAIRDWERYTCLDFKTRTTEANYIEIGKQTGCWSYIGMIKGKQDLSLGSGCFYKRIVIHELGHALGLHHEQTRPDRDEYVSVLNQNIKSGKEGNFKKHSTRFLNDYGVPYDYTGVMHYGQTAFSKNGLKTIVTKDPVYQDIIGTGNGLSFRDIKMVNLMYSCPSNCRSVNCPGEGFIGKNCKCWCPGNPVVECGDRCKYKSTPDHYSYTDIADISDSGSTTFTFRVRACHDVHVGFYATAANAAMYVITIGGGGNAWSSIRRNMFAYGVAYDFGARLSCTYFREFWISYSNGWIQVGEGKLKGRDVFMNYIDPIPHPAITNIGITTGWGASGEWYYSVSN